MEINGETFYECSDSSMRSPETSFVPDSSGVTRSMMLRGQVDEQRRFRAAKALLGYAVMRSDVPGAGLTRRWIERQLPHAWIPPDDPDINPDGDSFLYAATIPRMWGITQYSGSLDQSTAPEYSDGVYLQARYAATPHFFSEDAQQIARFGPLSGGVFLGSPPGWPVDLAAKQDEGDTLATRGWLFSRYIIRKVRHAPKLITVAGSFLRYAEGTLINTMLPGNQQFSQYRCDVQYTWVGVPVEAIPHNQIGRLSEKVNDDTFDFAPKGTLRFCSNEISQYRGPLGNMLADVTYHMQYMPNFGKSLVGGMLIDVAKGWNAIPAPNVFGIITNVYVSADGALPTGNNNWFKYGDFTGLFRPPQDLDDA